MLNGRVTIDVKAAQQAEPLLSQAWDRVFNARSYYPAHIMQFNVAVCGPSAENHKIEVWGCAHLLMLIRSDLMVLLTVVDTPLLT